MQLEVIPPLDDEELRALAAALELAALRPGDDGPHRRSWRVAGLRESVDDETEVGYALSPRSTRGATRA